MVSKGEPQASEMGLPELEMEDILGKALWRNSGEAGNPSIMTLRQGNNLEGG